MRVPTTSPHCPAIHVRFSGSPGRRQLSIGQRRGANHTVKIYSTADALALADALVDAVEQVNAMPTCTDAANVAEIPTGHAGITS